MDEKLAAASNDQILHRIRGEYLEMPGLRLTQQQAQRLWGLDRASCVHILDALTETGFLCRKEDGTYARLSEGRLGVRRSA
jgi:DNA-binding IclR family transcriptional regulator